MQNISKRLEELHGEVSDVCDVEKKRKRIEFATGVMAGHQHQVSLFEKDGKLIGKTERKDGHVHNISIGIVEKDILGFTATSDNHKHRISHKLKLALATKGKKG